MRKSIIKKMIILEVEEIMIEINIPEVVTREEDDQNM
jgi:hypothetical protein